MTTSRMEHQHSVHPSYPHHPFNMTSSDISHGTTTSSFRNSNKPFPPLACLSEAAEAMSSATSSNNKDTRVHRLEYAANTAITAKRNGDSGQKSNSQFTHQLHPSRQQQQDCSRSNENYNHKSEDSKENSGGTPFLQDGDSEMNAATSDIQRRESMSMDHVSTITPTPSPHGRPSDYNRDLSSHPNNQRYTNDNQHDNNNHHHLASPESQYNKGPHEVQQQHHYPQKHGPHSSQTTPSPPLPTQDGFQGRPLPPIEPSNSLYTYMNNSRRGSLADPDYYPPGPGGDAHKRPSVSVMDTSNGYNGSSTGGGGGGGGEGRHYATTPPLSSAPELHYPSHPATSPMQLRQSEHGLGRRESLPSIHSSAGPIGQLLAQEPQRRHSIANGDQVGPLKRKTSSTPLSQVHSSIEQEHPSKRRDSIPDAALLHHLANSHHPNHHHPYHPRSSFSAPSSPPRRGSNAHAHGHNQVPVLNLQPAAEIKPSSSSTMIPSSAPSPNLQNGPPPNMMDHGSNRPLFPLHQPRRPSLLSDASLSRRSSLADPHHYPVHFQQQQGHPHTSSSSSSSQDYDHNMNMDMERMHLSSEAVPGSGGAQNSHLYPGYPSDGAPSAKGDTPYSRSPELRVSHKLAERKRRKEMKELFDELRDSLPVDRSLKTSKWEILSKAVDYISSMKANQEEMSNEIDMLRQELARLQKH